MVSAIPANHRTAAYQPNRKDRIYRLIRQRILPRHAGWQHRAWWRPTWLRSWRRCLVAVVVAGQAGAEAWPQLRIALTIDSVLLAGVMLCFAGQAHYGRRIPFWNEFRAVIFAGTAALLGNGFVMYSLQRHDSRLLLVLTWALFPLFVMAARADRQAGACLGRAVANPRRGGRR